MKLRIRLSEHFTYSKLLGFTLPSIVMNIFTSLYSIVDGFLLANVYRLLEKGNERMDKNLIFIF